MIKIINQQLWLPIFFGISACSLMPHWACHYYRIETGSSFVVGSYSFTILESIFSMIIYSVLIGMNLYSIAFSNLRFIAVFLSGIMHITLGMIHVIRIVNPFEFIVFGYPWSTDASLREIIIVFPFGIICLAVARSIYRIT